MNKLVTTKQQNSSALRIYYSVYLRVFGVGLLSYIAVICAIFWMVNLWYPGFLNGNFQYIAGAMGGAVGISSTAQERGMNALRQAGLLYEADVWIERTVADSRGGPTVEIPASISGKWIMVSACLLLCAALVGVIFISSDSLLFQIVCAIGALVMGGIAVAVWVSKNQPQVRLNDRGIFVCSGGLNRKIVPWRKVARARFQRVASAPSFGLFSLLDEDTSEIISLEDGDGKLLLALNAHIFKGSPTIKARFIAELRGRLTGETTA